MEVERYKMIYANIRRKELMTDLFYYMKKITDTKNENDNIRILGKDFVKKNENKGKLIINNKKYKLKEFINSYEIKEDKIKIDILLSKELSNISHLFDNCENLENFYFFDDEINMEDEAYYLLEENNDYDKDLDFNENVNDNCEHSLYKNIRTDDIYSNYSEITTETKMEEKYNKVIIINFFKI